MRVQDQVTLDETGLRTNQAAIITSLAGAFIFDLPILVLITALIMLLGTVFGKPGFYSLYSLLRKARLVKPDLHEDHPEPHRFAQGFGGLVLVLAALAFCIQIPLIGWALTWIVIGLAAINLFIGFCLGCAIYYGLSRLGIPGFAKSSPPKGTPGWKPSKTPE